MATIPTVMAVGDLRRKWFACERRSLMTRSICFIIAFARIFTSAPISTSAVRPRATTNPGTLVGAQPGTGGPNDPSPRRA